MNSEEVATKRLEYQMAQEMLRHYDSLNWQIGSILVAASLVLTGLALNKDVLDLAQASRNLRLAVTLGIPMLSFFVLGSWLLWFRRHRALYNLRNEVLHRLEMQLGMYHHLLSAESDGTGDQDRPDVEAARVASGHHPTAFRPLYEVRLPSPSGYWLAKCLAVGVPIAQFLLLSFATAA